MKEDLRKYNGGKRSGSGPKPKPESEKKVQLIFGVKAKHSMKARKQISKIVDNFNNLD